MRSTGYNYSEHPVDQAQMRLDNGTDPAWILSTYGDQLRRYAASRTHWAAQAHEILTIVQRQVLNSCVTIDRNTLQPDGEANVAEVK